MDEMAGRLQDVGAAPTRPDRQPDHVGGSGRRDGLEIVARWNLRLTAGTRNLVLALPPKARHRGRDTLRVQIGNAKAKTVAVILRP